MGIILVIAGVGLLALLAVEYGLYRRAKKRARRGAFDGAFDQGLPFVAGVDLDHGDARLGDLGALDHIDPTDLPGV